MLDFLKKNGLKYGIYTILVIGIGYFLVSWIGSAFSSSGGEDIIEYTATKEKFVNEITEKGEVSSSENKEITCEVQAKYTSNITILKIIPEGTMVKKGDWLCTLDSSKLEDQRDSQEIALNNAEASVVQAESNLETAKIAKKEYLEGTYILNETQYKSKVTVEEEDLRRLKEYKEYSQKLYERGYVTSLQLESDVFAVESARLDLISAQTQLKVYQEYSKAKQVIQLDSDIASAEANLAAKKRALEVDKLKMAEIEDQIKKCNITAPQDGQVVYANESSRHGTNVVIEEGLALRERQAIIRLPNPEKMQVECRINEGKIWMVRVGMQANIFIDSIPDTAIPAEIVKVNDYAEPSNFFTGNIKEYKVRLRIINPPAGIRSGLTAQCKILVESQDDVLTVPVHCVFEHGGKHYCITHKNGVWDKREVKIGSCNDLQVVILGGLEEGEKVVAGANAYKKNVDLPKLTDALERAKTNSVVSQRATTLPEKPAPPAFGDGERRGPRNMPKMPSWFKPGMRPEDMTDEQRAEMRAIFQRMGPPRGQRMGPPPGMRRPRKSKDDPSFGVLLPEDEVKETNEQTQNGDFPPPPDGDFPPPPPDGKFPPPPPPDGAAPPPPPPGGGGGPGPGGPPPM